MCKLPRNEQRPSLFLENESTLVIIKLGLLFVA